MLKNCGPSIKIFIGLLLLYGIAHFLRK